MFAGALMIPVEEGCTKAQGTAVFSAIETSCQTEVLLSSVIPSDTDAGVVAKDIADVCQIADALLPAVETVVVSIMASQADAGTAPGGLYVPSPLVVRAKNARSH